MAIVRLNLTDDLKGRLERMAAVAEKPLRVLLVEILEKEVPTETGKFITAADVLADAAVHFGGISAKELKLSADFHHPLTDDDAPK